MKILLQWALKKLDLYSLMSLKRRGYLFDKGWFVSYRLQQSVDATGSALPWITYPAISFLEKRLTQEMTVFEYGVGNSTFWWAGRVKEVISVEHDKEWFDRIRNNECKNVTLFYEDLEYGGNYSKKSMDYNNHFDIIIVDGRDRINCMKNCLRSLKETGIVILDNSYRQEYIEGVNFLLLAGFKKIEFVGMIPIMINQSETTIFYRPNNSLGI